MIVKVVLEHADASHDDLVAVLQQRAEDLRATARFHNQNTAHEHLTRIVSFSTVYFSN
jgi:hypothetical protein